MKIVISIQVQHRKKSGRVWRSQSQQPVWLPGCSTHSARSSSGSAAAGMRAVGACFTSHQDHLDRLTSESRNGLWFGQRVCGLLHMERAVGWLAKQSRLRVRLLNMERAVG